MMFATQLFLILSVATVVLGQDRVCYVDEEGTSGFGPGRSDGAATLEDCKDACDANVRCVALQFEIGGISCFLFFDLEGTTSNENSILSRIAPCTTDPCNPDPCLNGATCLLNATTESFDCICPFGFAGDTCEKECDFSCPPPKDCYSGNFQLVDPQDGSCPDFVCVEKENVYNRKRGYRRENVYNRKRGYS